MSSLRLQIDSDVAPSQPKLHQLFGPPPTAIIMSEFGGQNVEPEATDFMSELRRPSYVDSKEDRNER